MERKIFFTTEFYENPSLTLDVLNQLVQTKQVVNKDMYQNGTFLYMEVFENDITKDILSLVISNLEEYKKYNAECFVSDNTTEIGICALQDEHQRMFYRDGKEIKWDADAECFVFEEDLI